jgi:hypothetical protein
VSVAPERRPLTRQRSSWKNITDEMLTEELLPWPASWHRRRVGDGVLLACAADEPGIGWHLSISFRDHRGEYSRYPTWDEIAAARDELLPADLTFVMFLPRAGHYLAIHDTTFHLHQHHDQREDG